ncbi:hypothetical protein MUK42_33828 [Musa troglodytarum]|uniref:Uncharacterized protein n=1 Tax=Musa troglodytarum TaxID=320322 RepID=A0A9E7FEZ4_9LILI|nr:hypothetical protein MUK42_33828 [Musa troglodytarum]
MKFLGGPTTKRSINKEPTGTSCVRMCALRGSQITCFEFPLEWECLPMFEPHSLPVIHQISVSGSLLRLNTGLI